MTLGDEYRVKAAEFHAMARAERDRDLREQFESLALGYLRLAAQADRNTTLDVTYEPAPPKLNDPQAKEEPRDFRKENAAPSDKKGPLRSG